MNVVNIQPGPEPERYSCQVTLPQWRLHVAHLTLAEGRDHGDVMDLAADGAAAMLRSTFPDGRMAKPSMAASIHDSLEQMGHDLKRTPPVIERLVHDCQTDRTLIRGSLAWDFLVLLIAKSQASWSVLDPREVEPPLVFREGLPGEVLQHAGGSLDCSGLPVLADTRGVVATPWTYRPPDELERCRSPLYICYLPEELFRKVQPRNHMGNAIWLTWVYKFLFERTCKFEG